jgi:hypothetical protein
MVRLRQLLSGATPVNLYSIMSVSDGARSRPWFEAFFGRPADRVVGEEHLAQGRGRRTDEHLRRNACRAAMRAGLIDEHVIAAHPVLVGGGTPFFTALDSWVNLNLLEARTFPDGLVLTGYETTR